MGENACGKCNGTGIESYVNHGPGEEWQEPIKCESCDGFGHTTSHPTPVQGEALPVVAKVVDTDITGARIVRVMRPIDIGTQLTDHAQATAEIAKRDEVIERHSKTLERIARQDIPAWQAERTTLRQQLSTALAESGEMRANAGRYLYIVENVATGSIGFGDWWIGAGDSKDDWDSNIDLARHTTTQESADNG